MGGAPGAFSFLLLMLGGSALITAQDTASKNEELSSSEVEPTTSPALRGFVTPRPFVLFDHPISSTWGAWSAWSFCVNSVRIRVRACKTVRGFSCIGANQETQPCLHSLYNHHPGEDLDVVDPYEEDRKEALRQLYPDEIFTDALALAHRPNPPHPNKNNANFLRFGPPTTPVATTPSAVEQSTTPRVIVDDIILTDKEAEQVKAEEEEIPDRVIVDDINLTDKEVKEEREGEFKKARGAKTETAAVPAQVSAELEKLEVHRESESRRQHSSNYHQLKKGPYMRDGSMGAGYTLLQNGRSSVSALDLLEETLEETNPSPLTKDTERKTVPTVKVEQSKQTLAKISQLLAEEIEELERRVKTGKEMIEKQKQTRGESRFIDDSPSDPRYRQFEGNEYSGGPKSTTAKPKHTTSKTAKHLAARAAIYDEAILDTDHATFDDYEEWIGTDTESKEVHTKKGKGGIPLRPKSGRTQPATTSTSTTSTTTAAPAAAKQGKIAFDRSDFLKNLLSSDYADYEDINHDKKKLDGETETTSETKPPPPTPTRSDQLNKVRELENLLGLPHMGLMDGVSNHEPEEEKSVWAPPSPQFRSEGGGKKKKTMVKKKVVHKTVVDVDNAETEKKNNMVDVDNAEHEKKINMVDIDNPEPVKKKLKMIDSDSHSISNDPAFFISRPLKVKSPRMKTKSISKPSARVNSLFDTERFFTTMKSILGSTMQKPLRERGGNKKKALSFGITGKKHESIHDGEKIAKLLSSRIKAMRKKKIHRPAHKKVAKPVTHVSINEDTARALDWMMHTIGVEDVRPAVAVHGHHKYQRAKIGGSKAKAEIAPSPVHSPQMNKKKSSSVVDSTAIGSPMGTRRPALSVVSHPAKVLNNHKQLKVTPATVRTTPSILHDSDAAPTRKAVLKTKTTPLPLYPPDISPPVQKYLTALAAQHPSAYVTSPDAKLPVQKSLPPPSEQQPLYVLPPALDEATDEIRYPRDGQFGGFELDGSSPDAAAYLASEATARPAKVLPKKVENVARGVRTVTSLDRKRLIGGAYTSASGVAAFPSKFVDNKSTPRQPIAGLPEEYLKSGRVKIVDNDVIIGAKVSKSIEKITEDEEKEEETTTKSTLAMHDGSAMSGGNAIAAEIERLEKLVNENKEQFNSPTFSDKAGGLNVPDEFAPLLFDPKLLEDSLKEIKEENKLLGLTDSSKETGKTSDGDGKSAIGSWSRWSEWGECLCGRQLRTRSCETADGTQVGGCQGSSYESQECAGGSCPTAESTTA